MFKIMDFIMVLNKLSCVSLVTLIALMGTSEGALAVQTARDDLLEYERNERHGLEVYRTPSHRDDLQMRFDGVSAQLTRIEEIIRVSRNDPEGLEFIKLYQPERRLKHREKMELEERLAAIDLIDAKEFSKACRILNELESCDIDVSEEMNYYYLHLGIKLFTEKKYLEAFDNFKRAEQTKRNDTRALAQSFLAKTGQEQEKVAQKRAEAHSLARIGKFAEAYGIFTELGEGQDADSAADCQFQRGKAFFEERKFSEAMSYFMEAAQSKRSDIRASTQMYLEKIHYENTRLHSKANQLVEEKNYEDALKTFRQIQDVGFGDFNNFLNIIYCQFEISKKFRDEKKFEEARSILKEVSEILKHKAPKDPQQVTQWQHHKEEVEDYLRIISDHQSTLKQRSLQAHAFVTEKKYDQASQIFKEVKEAGLAEQVDIDKMYFCLNQIGKDLLNRHKEDDALRLFEEAEQTRVQKDKGLAQFYMGQIYKAKGGNDNLAAAAGYLELASENMQKPVNIAKANFQLGCVYVAQKSYRAAADRFVKVVKGVPSSDSEFVKLLKLSTTEVRKCLRECGIGERYLTTFETRFEHNPRTLFYLYVGLLYKNVKAQEECLEAYVNAIKVLGPDSDLNTICYGGLGIAFRHYIQDSLVSNTKLSRCLAEDIYKVVTSERYRSLGRDADYLESVCKELMGDVKGATEDYVKSALKGHFVSESRLLKLADAGVGDAVLQLAHYYQHRFNASSPVHTDHQVRKLKAEFWQKKRENKDPWLERSYLINELKVRAERGDIYAIHDYAYYFPESALGLQYGFKSAREAQRDFYYEAKPGFYYEVKPDFYYNKAYYETDFWEDWETNLKSGYYYVDKKNPKFDISVSSSDKRIKYNRDETHQIYTKELGELEAMAETGEPKAIFKLAQFYIKVGMRSKIGTFLSIAQKLLQKLEIKNDEATEKPVLWVRE